MSDVETGNSFVNTDARNVAVGSEKQQAFLASKTQPSGNPGVGIPWDARTCKQHVGHGVDARAATGGLKPLKLAPRERDTVCTRPARGPSAPTRVGEREKMLTLSSVIFVNTRPTSWTTRDASLRRRSLRVALE